MFVVRSADEGEGEGLSFLGGVLGLSDEGERLRLVPFVPVLDCEVMEANVSVTRAWNEDQVDCVWRSAEGGQGPCEMRRRRASTVWVSGELGEERRDSIGWWYSGGTEEVERSVWR